MKPTLMQVVEALRKIAPPELAETWDNVGLLLCPSDSDRVIKRMLLTIDTTEAVVAEAIRSAADMVVSYHPPIFEGVKHLRHHRLVPLIENHVALYTPHTALDAAKDGINDWLASGLGEAEVVEPINLAAPRPPGLCKIVAFAPHEHADKLREALSRVPGLGWIGNYSHCSFNITGVGTFLGHEGANPTIGKVGRLERVDEVRIEMVCPKEYLPMAARVIERVHPYETPAWEVYALEAVPPLGVGQGRRVVLKKPVTLPALVDRIKAHLGLKQVRVATARHEWKSARISRIGLCAGAGGSVLDDLDGVDVLLTGEMRHHDVLAANAKGQIVILCDHTHTERGYLPVLKRRLHEALGKSLRIDLAKSDREPLQIV